MTKSKLALYVAVPAFLPTLAAHAQVTIDVSKITCEQLILYQITNSENIAVWLHGYYSAKQGTTTVDTQAFKANANKVKAYCRMNSKVTVIQAVETVFGPKK
jgi:acid stress chaperone HdeB